MTPFNHSSFSVISCQFLEQVAGALFPNNNNHQLIYIKSGKILQSFTHQKTELNEEQVVFFPAHSTDKIQCKEDSSFFSIDFKTEAYSGLTPIEFTSMNNHYKVDKPSFTTQFCEHILSSKLDLEKSSLLQFLLAPILNQNQENNKNLNRLLPVLDYIEKNLHYSPRSEELAEVLNLDKNYFNSFFRKKMKLSPGQYIKKRKVQLACNMLQNQQTVSEITEKLGFYDTSHFCRTFKKRNEPNPKTIPTISQVKISKL